MLWMVLGDFIGETEYSVYDRISYRKKDELFRTPKYSTRVRLATIFGSALIGWPRSVFLGPTDLGQVIDSYSFHSSIVGRTVGGGRP